MKDIVTKYIKQYTKLTKEYLDLDTEFNVKYFEDKIYYDALGYQNFLHAIYDNKITNKELLEAQFDLATKVNDLKMILKNIKANQKLMNRINAIYG